MKTSNYDYLTCPKCGVLLDRATLYSMDCICFECGHFIDLDETEDDYMYNEEYYENFWEQYENYLYKDKEGEQMNLLPNNIDKENDDMIKTLVIRFITKTDYKTIKKSFELLDASIDYLELTTDGPINKFLETSSGKKLAKGLNIDLTKIDEYRATLSFIFGEDYEDNLKTLISTFCEAFPLCMIREEDSAYIMANNKGLAKGIAEMCNDDEIEILNMFLTGYNKYKLLCNFLYWVPPYSRKDQKDIMLKWENNSLISLKTIREEKEVPIIWQDFLNENDSIMVSCDDKDDGKLISFETILEDVVNNERDKNKIKEDENIIQLISLRGTKDFAIGAD